MPCSATVTCAPIWWRPGCYKCVIARHSTADLAEYVGLEEALDEQHEEDRRHQQNQRRDRGDLIVATHAGAVEQQRQGRHARHADEEGSGEFVKRFQEQKIALAKMPGAASGN